MQRQNELTDEINTLQYSLKSNVDKHMDQIYEEARSIVDELKGSGGKSEGELDILEKLSNSVSELENQEMRSGLETSNIVDESRQALKYQSILVDKYHEKLESYLEGMNTLYDRATDFIDEEELNDARNNLMSLEEETEELWNLVGDRDYGTVDEALEETVREGFSESPFISQDYGAGISSRG